MNAANYNDVRQKVCKSYESVMQLVGDINNHPGFSVHHRFQLEEGFFCIDVWKEHKEELLRTVSKRHQPTELLQELEKLVYDLQAIKAVNHIGSVPAPAEVITIPVPSRGARVQLHSNDYVDFANIDALRVNIEDIAHALSMLCRFNGHTREFYSVAQHSVLVSYLVPAEFAMTALLHDAAEAYCGDVVSPLKELLPTYQAIHNNIERTIFNQLGVKYPAPACVREADIKALATEVRDLMPHNPALWHNIQDIEPHHETIEPMEPHKAESLFMLRYFDLQAQQIARAS